MRLVDDDDVVLPQQRIALRLGQQDPVRHELELRLLGDDFRETHLPADFRAYFHLKFLRDSLRHRRRRQSPWLSAAYPKRGFFLLRDCFFYRGVAFFQRR